jgi:hypothetical protein
MRAGFIIAALWLLAACRSTASLTANHGYDDGTLSVTADRLIVVTIDNGNGPLLAAPGSTPHAYSATGTYTVSDQARALGVALARDYGLRKVREWPIAPLKVQCLVFAVAANTDRDVLLRRLSDDHRVKLAQRLQLFNALGNSEASSAQGSILPVSATSRLAPPVSAVPSRYNDPYYGLQHGFNEVGAGPAQQWSTGEGISVAIIDTGVATAHPDLDGRVALIRNFVNDDMDTFQTDRHGTEVAGIIGAVANNGLGIVGIAPAARLQIYKACEPAAPHSMEAVCNSFTLARALGAAIDAHAQIVNLSLGGPADPLLSQLVDYGQQHGVIFVGAVPEDGRLDGFPLAIAGVIAVDEIGRSVGVPAVLHAPGRDIVSTAPGGSYDFATGSSFAAAHVTAAIALLRSRVASLNASSLLAVLGRSAGADSWDHAINICAALDAVQPRDRCMNSTQALAAAE